MRHRPVFHFLGNSCEPFGSPGPCGTGSTIVRLYSGSDGQPIYAFISYASQGISATCFANAGPKAAFAADQATPDNAGDKIGGWLARDPTGTLSRVLPTDGTYTTCTAYLTMPSLSVIGSSGAYLVLSGDIESNSTFFRHELWRRLPADHGDGRCERQHGPRGAVIVSSWLMVFAEPAKYEDEMRKALLLLLVASACQSSPKTLADTGFYVTRVAFAFAYFAGPSGERSMPNSRRAFVRRGECHCAGGATLVHQLTPAAQNWANSASLFLADGQCEGFSILSQLVFVKAEAAETFGAATTHAPSPSATHFATRARLLGDNPARAAHRRRRAAAVVEANDALAFFGKRRAEGQHRQAFYRVGMVDVVDGKAAGAHSVTPIGVDQISKTLYSLRVYDSNVVGAEPTIAIDTSKNTWSYASADPNNKVTLSGDATNPSLYHHVFAASRHVRMPVFAATRKNYTIAFRGGTVDNLDFGDATVTQTPIFTQSLPRCLLGSMRASGSTA